MLKFFRNRATFAIVAIAFATVHAGYTQATRDFLAGNTVLIIRHAEKPKLGTGLTEAGLRRATAYVHYFQPLHEAGLNTRITALYAGADSKGSNRPRLTLEPLAAASHLQINDEISTKDPAALVALLRSRPHGSAPLICWRHGQIPALLTTFGASPETLLPGGTWPDDTYDWLLVLTFDKAGKLTSQRLVNEDLK